MSRIIWNVRSYIYLSVKYGTFFDVYKIQRWLKNEKQRKRLRRKRERLFNLFGKCRNCGSTEDLTIDHIIPKSKGGTNHSENLQVLCSNCNNRKADRIMVF